MSDLLDKMVQLNCYCDIEDMAGGEGHWHTCPQAHMEPTYETKAEFVHDAGLYAKFAIQSYQMILNTLDITSDEAMEMAVQEAEESASCFAGIGSCGIGGCKHS